MTGSKMIVAGLATLLLPGVAAVDCFEQNMKYVGEYAIVPNGAVVYASHCQHECSITFNCKYFTFVGIPCTGCGITKCYKFKEGATLVPADGPTANLTLSGPVTCPPATATSTPAPGAGMANGTLPASATTPATPATTVAVPTVTTCINGTCGIVVPPASGGESGGGFPTWAIALIVVGVILLAVLAMVLLGACGGEEKKKKKSSKAKKAKKEMKQTPAAAAVVEAAEVESLVRTEAPPPMSEPVVPAAMTVQPAAMPAAMPAPMPAGSQMATPVYTSQGQVFTSTGQVYIPQTQQVQIQQPLATGVQMVQAPFMSGGARQPQLR